MVAVAAVVAGRLTRIRHRLSASDHRAAGSADAGGQAPDIVIKDSSFRSESSTVTLNEVLADHGLPICDCPGFWRFREGARWLYQHNHTQSLVAVLIVGNFIMNIVECWIDPQKERFAAQFTVAEDMFNVAFALELLLNSYAYWFFEFWKESWNWFDVLVVMIGLVTTFRVPMPGPLSLLRLVRAFRVFRLFRRIPSLRKIIRSLAKALPGVANAFVLQAMFMSIFAVLSVDFYQLFGEGGTITTESGEALEQVTARGMDHGFEYFGNFPKASYTMFQILTGDSWSEVVVRPLMITPSWFTNALSALFFCTFVIVNGVVLINIVVAVLLENFVAEDPVEEDPMAPKWTKENRDSISAQPTLPWAVASHSASPRPSPRPAASPAASPRDQPSKSTLSLPVLGPPSGGLLHLPHIVESTEIPQGGTTYGSEAFDTEAAQNLRQEVLSAKSEMDEVKRLMQVILEGLAEEGQDSEEHFRYEGHVHDHTWVPQPPSLKDVEPPPVAEVPQLPMQLLGATAEDFELLLRLHGIPSAELPRLDRKKTL